jgi:hypothetical protein
MIKEYQLQITFTDHDIYLLEDLIADGKDLTGLFSHIVSEYKQMEDKNWEKTL